MNNINRQKKWLRLLLGLPIFLGFLLYALPEILGKKHIMELPVLISLVVACTSIVGLMFTRAETNYQNFQGQFIKLIDLHRNNVDSVDLSNFKSNYPVLNKHYFFQIVLDEFEEVKAFISIKIKERKTQDIILYESLEREQKAADTANLYLEELTTINISYLIVFFGMEHGKSSLKSALSKTYTETIISEIFEWIDLFKNLDNVRQSIPLHGYQGVLGHYYRHLFSAIKFLNEAHFVIDNEKINLAKILRAQLSTFEQSLLLINSLSILGRKWEIESDEGNKNLITKYNLVRNIPSEFFIGVNPKQIYPNVNYE